MSPRALLVAFALLAISSTGYANVVAGRDYQQLRQPQPTETKSKTEVIEFFSFGCPGCYQMHRKILAWAGKLPADVQFRRVPVGFGKPGWVPLAKAYYALEATGDLNRLDTALFDAIHKEHLPLMDEQSITAWAVKNGVDGAKFKSAFNSFGVQTRLAQTERMMAGYEVAHVPTVIVDGRYNVMGDSYDQMLANASELITKAKAERPAKKS
jgi:protein dithiol oxidoreductase (disulfide-forming)